MSSVVIHPPNPSRHASSPNPLPQLIATPSGLALLELQGTINIPPSEDGEPQSVSIGKIDFPNYRPGLQEEGSTAWMKKAYLYVGRDQRLTGEVKKLPKPVAVVRRRGHEGETPNVDSKDTSDLEIMEIVKYKIVFSQRPEPINAQE